MLDLTLAILHHLLFAGLVVMLASQAALLRLEAPPLARLSAIDAGYGMTALLILAVGFARAVWAAKGWDFYAANPWFWAKIGTFAAVGLISIGPTLQIIRWRKASRADPAYVPSPADLKRARAFKAAEIAGVLLIVAFAAAMARWPF